MGVPEFDTAIQLYRDWSRRGATEDEIRNAIACRVQAGLAVRSSSETATVEASGPTPIILPVAGQRARIKKLRIQNETGQDQKFLLIVESTARQTLFTSGKATGINDDLDWLLPLGAGLSANASTADRYSWTAGYYYE